MNWYVIYVKTGCEGDICACIDRELSLLDEALNYKLVVPKKNIYKSRNGNRYQIKETLFPGYILCKTDNIAELNRRVQKIHNIYCVLKNDKDFLQIEKSEIRRICESMAKKNPGNASELFAVKGSSD